MNKLVVAASFIALAFIIILMLRDMNNLQHRMDEMNCVHYIYEDGSAVHIDAEVALQCLRNH